MEGLRVGRREIHIQGQRMQGEVSSPQIPMEGWNWALGSLKNVRAGKEQMHRCCEVSICTVEVNVTSSCAEVYDNKASQTPQRRCPD